jgi:hypothetical protein
MKTGRIVRHIRDDLQRHGIGATLHDLAYRTLNFVADFEALKGMTARLGDVRDPALFEAPGFDGRFVEPDALAYGFAGAHELWPTFLQAAAQRGDRCYALFQGETLASYGWYSDLPSSIDDNFVLHFDPAYVYMYKGYTVPAYRGLRLHAVGMCRALSEFTAEGKAGLISYVQSNNFASLRSVARMGYRIFGTVFLARVGGRSLTYATRGCRDYDFWVEPTVRPSPIIR